MITYDHDTLRLFGLPLFTLIATAVFLAALAGLTLGVCQWRQRAGKIVAVASAFVLLLYALVILCVLVTVGTGSMG